MKGKAKKVLSMGLPIRSIKAVRALLTRKVRIEFDRIPFEFANVPFGKVLNWVLVEASALLKTESPWGLPTHLQVEPSSCCNLGCPFCPVTTGMNRSSGNMDPVLFQRLVDETCGSVFLIVLWNWGEPFLNPAIYEMISYARQRDIAIVSSTNGHIFARENHAEQLVASGIDSVIFAIDGITQETYERYRKSGDLNTAISGIKRVVAAKRAMTSDTPFIDFRFIVMRHNEHEVPSLRNFAESLGVDALTLRSLNPYAHGECRSSLTDGTQFVPIDPVFQRFEYESEKDVPVRKKRNPCKRLWNNPVVNWSGSVSPCCYDPHERYVMGNLGSSTFRDIWSGEPYRKLRRQFREDYMESALCSECPYAFEGSAGSADPVVEACFFNSPAPRQHKAPGQNVA